MSGRYRKYYKKYGTKKNAIKLGGVLIGVGIASIVGVNLIALALAYMKWNIAGVIGVLFASKIRTLLGGLMGGLTSGSGIGGLLGSGTGESQSTTTGWF